MKKEDEATNTVFFQQETLAIEQKKHQDISAISPNNAVNPEVGA
jgi:hypothetical protein